MPNKQDLGYFEGTGIVTPLYISYADREGTSPGAIMFTMRRQPGWKPSLIKLVLNFNSFRYTLVDCKVDSITEANSGTDLFWQVSCFDRRFRWKYPTISGMYNRYLEDGSLWRRSEKSPRDLLTLLFKELGEKNFDVSKVPNVERPEMRWENANVACELDSLARRLGCRVCHMLNDTYAVLPIGVGKPPKVDFNVESFTQGLTFEGGPDAIAIRFRRRNEVDLRLQAVGLTLDGQIKPIDELSYKPVFGWNGEYPGEFSGSYYKTNSRYSQELARSCIWRYFQITPYGKRGTNSPIQISGYKGPSPKTLEEILPVFAEGVAYKADLPGDDWFNSRSSATVWGCHVNGSIAGRMSLNTVANDRALHAWEEEPFEIADAVVTNIGFDIDPERGLVIFDEPIFRYGNPADGDDGFCTPFLTVRLSITLRDPKTLGELFYEVKRDRKTQKKGTKPLVISCDEATADFWMVENTKPQNNKKLIDEIADHYLKQAEAEFQTNNPATVKYNDWRAVEMSGAITEVTWTLDASGPTTQVSYNDRHQYSHPSYNAIRLLQAQRIGIDSNQSTIKRLDTKSIIQRINRQQLLIGK